ncbi:MAG: hypothetical protein J6V87_01150 [Prevotella sp.]|nr:hypothetical protein [Prevotella sp.]
MNHAAGRMVLTFFLCCAMTTTVVNAQEAESPIKKGEHPAKAADDAPQDWKKQYNAAKFYMSEYNGTPNTILAEKYATRALEIAKSQTVKRDTILGKSFELMSIIGMANKNFDQMIGCYEQAIRAYVDELGNQNAAIPPRIALLGSMKWLLHSSGVYPYGDVDAVKTIREAFILNNQLPEGQRAKGMEDVGTIYALSHEILMTEYRQLMKDKVWLWTDQADGKIYTILAFDDWTVDQPAGFMTTMFIDNQNGKKESDFKYGFVLMDEQGNITERKPTEFSWYVNFNMIDNAFRLSDKTNLRVVSVPSEKHQQIVDAFHKFENNKD